ncbi:hypothetical protein SK128_022959, partial [Halocaridina rubra]
MLALPIPDLKAQVEEEENTTNRWWRDVKGRWQRRNITKGRGGESALSSLLGGDREGSA